MGLAYLPDGTTMDYKDYINSHPHWKEVKRQRLNFDGGKCVVCHKDVTAGYETHHLNYTHLGNEHMRDVVTMCSHCHTIFHNSWRKQEFWKGREAGHWETYSLEHTARMCAMYWREDRLICRDPSALNLCNDDVARGYVDRYHIETGLDMNAIIDPHDLTLFVRNKRYELYFEAESRGLNVEEFLDEYYGKKERGKNPLRQEAGKKKGVFDHSSRSFRAHYKENKNINKLMEEAKKYE